MYRYGEVEAALAKIFDIDVDAMGAFKGRIIHLQRLGLGPSSPGRGKKIEYSYENIAVWAFCLQLEEFGLDPTSLRAFLDASWSIALPSLFDEEEEDMIFYFIPNLMSRSFVKNIGPKAYISNGVVRASEANYETLRQRAYMPKVGAIEMSRFALLNLSETRRRLLAALKSTAT